MATESFNPFTLRDSARFEIKKYKTGDFLVTGQCKEDLHELWSLFEGKIKAPFEAAYICEDGHCFAWCTEVSGVNSYNGTQLQKLLRRSRKSLSKSRA